LANEDLTRLRIDRDAPRAAPRRRKYRWWWLAALAAAAAVFWLVNRNAAVQVEVSAVSQAYPSQAYTQLNATGYVVAQRKAAVASKATGRLEWLNVREGSQVKAGEVLARLESSDVTAQMKQAAAGSTLPVPTSSRARPS
jgi:multidrug efflux pump subunit AcrA (membrane-fusion protein)